MYDCTKDVKEHVGRVQKWMRDFSTQIIDRSRWHDKSKLEEPEKSMFDKFTPRLKELTFGSDAYRQALAEMGAALKHHYQANRHHPEHYENGVSGMTLVDLTEMVCDWMAAAQVKETPIDLLYLAKRFNLSDQLVEIIANTLREDDLWRITNGGAVEGEYCPPELRDRHIEGFTREGECQHGRDPRTCWECGQDWLAANFEKDENHG